ncbi:unnamed protein product [Ilex paraguariensis]|uniref:SET domain-containing protein n=1 Tax=Ilex paraguariensis TaxID=185542 RepID=A0ABC8U782_9AQUA
MARVLKNHLLNLRTRGLKYPLLVKRLACMVISGVASADCLDILQPANLSSDMIILMEEEYGLLKNAFEAADIGDEQMAFLTKHWYAGILARIRINAFRIELAGGLYEDLLLSAAASVEAEAAVGNAVYMLPSFYNHDCDPNAHILWIENVDAKLKALRDIEAGEEMRICYIDASMDRDARQAILSEGFGFQCHCLDPLALSAVFSLAQYMGEKRITDVDCFIQRSGLLVYLEDSYITRIESPGSHPTYWETTIGTKIEDCRTVEGVMIAHSRQSSAIITQFEGKACDHEKNLDWRSPLHR